MRRFLKNILIFSALVVTIFCVLEIVVRRLPNVYAIKHRMMEVNADKVATLIVGSSHTYYGLSPTVMGDSVYNLSNVSQSPEYDWALIRKWVPELPNLKRVVLGISYFSYREPKMEDMDYWYLASSYKIRMNIDTHSDFSIYNISLSDRKQFFGSLQSIFIKQRRNLCDSTGFGLGFDLGVRSYDWEQFGQYRADGLTYDNPRRVKEVIAGYRNIIEYLKARNIECIFITTPVWYKFRENMDDEQYEEMVSETEKLAREYKNVRYLNYFSSPAFDNEDFYDVDHLSSIGAEKLSKIVWSEIASMTDRTDIVTSK